MMLITNKNLLISIFTLLWVFIERNSYFMQVVRFYETASVFIEHLKNRLIDLNFIKIIP